MCEQDNFCETCKASLIEEHRGINVDLGYDWWDCVYDDFKADMKEKGIYVERMYFSGFWSQGDGACFEGSVEDWGKFLDAHGYEYPILRKLLDQGGWATFGTHHRGHYYHRYCADSSIEISTFYECAQSTDGVLGTIITALDNQLESETVALESDLLDTFRDHMQDLYRSLEQEYDYLTSDEVVWESILANELAECTCEEEEELAEAA